MSLISPANEKQNCKEEEEEEEDGTTSAITAPSSLVSEHSPTDAPMPDVPPPPPPLPGLGQRKRRVRSFYWKPIPEERVHQRSEPNLWTLGHSTEKHTFHIDIKTIEELFGQHDNTRSQTTTNSKSSQSPGLLQEPRKEISILDSKRSMNVAIFLKRFKKSNQSIVEDILNGKSDVFGSELLRELLKFLPEPEEVERLQAYRGDLSQLTTADSFMYHLTALPGFSLRIEALLLKEEFSPLCSSLKKDISTVRSATRELLSCTELHSILHLVLQAGNIMNTGGYGGAAVGFKLSSLLSLADTKANKPGMNLLHFVALEAQKKDEELLRFPEKLPHISNAARVSVESLDEELESLSLRISSMEEKLQTNSELLQQLHTFLQAAAGSLDDVRSSRAELQKEGDDMIDFFCEDKETFKLDECFHIFQNFCSKFRKAVQENMEREMRVESQRKRLRDQQIKRSSWAGLDKLGAAFGSRCSSETDVQAALKREGLWGLLRAHSLSPQSPLGQFGSLRRSRQQFGNSITDSHSAGITVEAQSLVPHLQAFNFDPLTEPQNNSTPTQIQDPQDPSQDDPSVPESQLNPDQESSRHLEQTIPITDQPEMDMSLDLLEKLNEEENSLSAASFSDQSAIITSNDSTVSTSQAPEPKLDHQSVLVSSIEAPGSDLTPNPDGQEGKDVQRQSISPEDKRSPIRTKSTSRPATPPETPESSSSQPSTSTNSRRHVHPVRMLTQSENQSMRKVIPLSRKPQTSTVPAISGTSQSPTPKRPSIQRSSTQRSPVQSSPLQRCSTQRSSTQRSPVQRSSTQRSSTQRSPVQTSPLQRSSTQRSSTQRSPVQRSSTQRSPVRKVVVQPKAPPEEKMCRSTLRALAQAGGSGAPPLQQNPSHSHAPHFAQGTVASATRRAAAGATGNLPASQSTVATTSKSPSLNRATSLRLGRSRSTSQSGGNSQSKVNSPSRVNSTSGVIPQSKVTSRSRTTSQSGVIPPSRVSSQNKVILPSRVTSQTGVIPQNKVTSQTTVTRTQSMHRQPSAGHSRKIISSEKSEVSHDSQKTPLKPVWK
ncbi:FH2 domain-containing protein 1-like [Astyanax mexicanus]|uniref:FH2 domain-containing protein 1-like n=1 Tax=Astyanax mexicanus TaxID=7994 RepID=A0A8T2LEW0_ASTMX|nr:FH2 domain-containing protein 1-like [Astyanax mexicanus]